MIELKPRDEGERRQWQKQNKKKKRFKTFLLAVIGKGIGHAAAFSVM